MEPVPLCQQKHDHFTKTSEQVRLNDFMLEVDRKISKVKMDSYF